MNDRKSPYKRIYLKRRKEESLLRFHPWIFSGAIERKDERMEDGDIVRVFSSEGEFLAVGHFQIGSIAVRVLSFEDIPIDRSFWEERIRRACCLRQSIKELDGKQTNIFRLIHGEGDNLPGLVVDVYGTTAVIQAHSVGMHRARFDLAEALKRICEDGLQNIYYKSDATLPFKADLSDECGFLYGRATDMTARENGLLFYIDYLKGQKTGFFVDQRNNRSLLESFARGRKVLNMFCYTGGFSVYALRGGAEEVVSVDSSAKAIEITMENVGMNYPQDARHKAVAEDAFKYLDKLEKGDYDLIILDPPAFAKHRNAINNALKGYTRLNQKAFEKIAGGGILFTFSCSQAISKEQFRLAVFTAAANAKRSVRILYQLHQPADHPINIYHPEGEYLKGLVLSVD